MAAGVIYRQLAQFREERTCMQSHRAHRLMPVGVFILILLSGASSSSFSQCEEGLIPSGMSQYLKTKFSDWKVVEVKDLLEYDRDVWLGEHSKACPGIGQGRFDPSGRWKTAILLIPKLPTDNRAKLILVDKKERKYSSIVLAEMNNRGQVPVVFTAPPGRYKSWDNSRNVTTRHAVVALVFYESSGTVFYWANGKFHELQVSD
jgi:hypothetical protein